MLIVEEPWGQVWIERAEHSCVDTPGFHPAIVVAMFRVAGRASRSERRPFRSLAAVRLDFKRSDKSILNSTLAGMGCLLP